MIEIERALATINIGEAARCKMRRTRVCPLARKINLHIYPTTMELESRILRCTNAMRHWSVFDQIVLVGVQGKGLPPEQPLDGLRTIVRVAASFTDSRSLPKRLARFASWYLGVIRRFRRERIACVNCHSLSTLPLGWVLKRLTGAKLIYDAHELETETIERKGLGRRLAKLTEALFIPSADAMIVVGPSIAEWYQHRYPGLRPAVVRNLPETLHSEVRYDLFRERLGIPRNSLIFLLQGMLAEGRGVETALAAFGRARSDRHLVFLGYGPLTALIQEHCRLHANIHYLPAVPPKELLQFTQSGDVGLCLIGPSCLSHFYSLPNKLFEYLGSGVPAIVTNLPELSAVMQTSGGGWIVRNDPESLLELVDSITREDAQIRGNKGRSWTRENSWEKESESLKDVYSGLKLTTS